MQFMATHKRVKNELLTKCKRPSKKFKIQRRFPPKIDAFVPLPFHAAYDQR